MARCAFMHNKINDVLDSNKNFWKELRNLGLLPENSDALHGFMTDKLNYHITSSISTHEDLQGMQQKLQNPPLEDFSFQPVSENDVALAVSHFKTQARGKDDIRIGIEGKKITMLLQFDFSKAFDTISPTRLMQKLQRFGFSRQ